MKKRDKMKMIGILILLLAVITVVITLILVSRLSKTAGNDQKEETFDHSVSGMLDNAYILKSEEKDIIVLYQGKTYYAEGKPEKKYTGVADIELTRGKVTKIYAKPSAIKGVLTSYSSKSVQIEGYEPLPAAENLPVYLVASSGHAKIPVRQGKTKKYGTVSIISAGWDPGSDSIVRSLLQAIAPKGITYTNFGPGMSMGHTVAVKAIEGVKAALSMTIPVGTGIHRRMVYVEIEKPYRFEDVAAAIKADDYFAHDETHVIQVDSVDELLDRGHGVNLVRKGVSGKTQNQLFEFDMKINNPALTGQVLVCVARAAMKQRPGCYTMIEVPVIDLLYGEREDLIAHLV